jgi:phosphoribosylaminoimidazolecarboxamide formyltransferase/IMP cyclohydrolase
MSGQSLALVSVSDKTGLVELGLFLTGRGVTTISTGGTAAALTAAGAEVVEAAEFTGSSEMLDGRVKTLHPKIHAGILHRRDVPDHVDQMARRGWPAIDLVVVNLYPFEKVSAKPESSFEEIVENIDIGGPCLLRAAAKNHESVVVISDPADYGTYMTELDREGGLSLEFRRRLAQKAFARVAAYDAAISSWFLRGLER